MRGRLLEVQLRRPRHMKQLDKVRAETPNLTAQWSQALCRRDPPSDPKHTANYMRVAGYRFEGLLGALNSTIKWTVLIRDHRDCHAVASNETRDSPIEAKVE